MQNIASGLLCFGIAIWYLCTGVSTLWNEHQLVSRGVRTTGTIVQTSKTYEGRSRRSTTYADVRFKTADGKLRMTYPSVDQAFLDSHRPPNNKAEVLYLAESPEVSHLEGRPWEGWKKLGICAALTGLAVLCTWSGISGLKQGSIF